MSGEVRCRPPNLLRLNRFSRPLQIPFAYFSKVIRSKLQIHPTIVYRNFKLRICAYFPERKSENTNPIRLPAQSVQQTVLTTQLVTLPIKIIYVGIRTQASYHLGRCFFHYTTYIINFDGRILTYKDKHLSFYYMPSTVNSQLECYLMITCLRDIQIYRILTVGIHYIKVLVATVGLGPTTVRL